MWEEVTYLKHAATVLNSLKFLQAREDKACLLCRPRCRYVACVYALVGEKKRAEKARKRHGSFAVSTRGVAGEIRCCHSDTLKSVLN